MTANYEKNHKFFFALNRPTATTALDINQIKFIYRMQWILAKGTLVRNVIHHSVTPCGILNGRVTLWMDEFDFFKKLFDGCSTFGLFGLFPWNQKVSQFWFSLVFALYSTLLLINDSHPLLTLPSLLHKGNAEEKKKDFLVKKLLTIHLLTFSMHD